MRETRIGEQLARRQIVVVVNQYAARKYAQRSVHDAHVAVEHEVMDVGTVQQRTHRRHQDRIIGPHKFTQGRRLPRLERPL